MGWHADAILTERTGERLKRLPVFFWSRSQLQRERGRGLEQWLRAASRGPWRKTGGEGDFSGLGRAHVSRLRRAGCGFLDANRLLGAGRLFGGGSVG